ncbi:hypothetical protein ABZ249_00710 [Nocardiopsis sp. NPDC006139]|uniref:hypothetical protein n=1 Tax=Nocardiopsis sp. NPDC006139 TaxID=3154578 RepID=UPI0033BCE8DF
MPRDESLVSIGFQEDVTEEEADRYTRDLALLLEYLDIDEVRLAEEGDSSAGTRSADPAAVAGAVVVVGVLFKPVLTSLVSLAGTWIEQSGQRSVTVEVDGNRVTVQGRMDPAEVEACVRALRAREPRPAGEADRPGGPLEPLEAREAGEPLDAGEGTEAEDTGA